MDSNHSDSTKNLLGDTHFGPVLFHALKAARIGREVLMSYFGRLGQIEEKFQAGLVSEADKESEKKIFAYLKQHFPDDIFLGEESTYITEHQSDSADHPPEKLQDVPDNSYLKVPLKKNQGRWIVDPLDGTTNYINQFPVFCISIGYECNDQIQVAVIDVPMLSEVYCAIRGRGSYMNGTRLKISQQTELSRSLLATGFVNEKELQLEEQLRIFSKVVRKSRAIRRAGAAAYDLALVARGVFDGYWEKGLYPWDSAAGLLLVEEAGGIVETYRGQKYQPFKKSLVAGPEKVVRQIQNEMKDLLNTHTD